MWYVIQTYSMPNQLVYVMNPNYSTVEKAEEYIDKIENNEIVTIQEGGKTQ